MTPVLTVTGITECRHGQYVGAQQTDKGRRRTTKAGAYWICRGWLLRCLPFPYAFRGQRARECDRVDKEQFRTRMMHTSDPADLSLLRRIAARDTAALAELYDRHSGLLFSLILRIVRDRKEAEDILQEVFVRVWTRAETYDARMGGPLPWIVRVARNYAIDRLRAQRVRATVDAPAIDTNLVEAAAPASAVQPPETVELNAERRRTITDALAGLPAEQRQLIEAAFFEGYTHSELAQRFGLPLRTVRARIRAGMLASRKKWAHAV